METKTEDSRSPAQPETANPIQEPISVPAETPNSQAMLPRPGLIARFSRFSKTELGIALLIIILLASGGSAYWFGYRPASKPVSSNQGAVSDSSAAADTNSGQTLQPKAVELSGNTYFDSVQPLPDLHFFPNPAFFGTYCATTSDSSCDTPVKASDIKYYRIGTTQDGRQIIAFVTPLVGLNSNTYYALGDGSGKYQILRQMNDITSQNPDGKLPANYLASNVSTNNTYVLKPIDFPKTAVVNGLKIKNSYADSGEAPTFILENLLDKGLGSIRGYGIGGPALSYNQIAQSGGFSFYKTVIADTSTYRVEEIYAVYKNLLSMPYSSNDEVSNSTSKLSVNWTVGVNTNSSFYSAGKSCGTYQGYLVAKNVAASSVTRVGVTSGGSVLYQLPTSSPLVQKLYKEDYSGGQYLDNKSLKGLSIQKYSDMHGYFLVKNALGEYSVYENSSLTPQGGGCAKPVIYLYPQKKTSVDVKLGAQIIKSEPVYGSQGWQNVTAYPGGSLEYSGKSYPYLFWEGYGIGNYPELSQGTIVKTAAAPVTVRQQLAQQGLKPQEVSDFMDYWQPRLLAVNNPYVRLSWLDTAAMNQLAPLYVSPKPNTVIRVFLDFQGLNKPYALAQQTLRKTPRDGFTLLEWGGYQRR